MRIITLELLTITICKCGNIGYNNVFKVTYYNRYYVLNQVGIIKRVYAHMNSSLTMYIDKAEFILVLVHGQGGIHPCPCTWIGSNSILSLYMDRAKFRPVPVHGQGGIDPVHVHGHARIGLSISLNPQE